MTLDVVTILAVVEERDAVVAFAEIRPLLRADLEACLVPTGVRVGGAFDMPVLDLVGGAGAVDGDRAGLQPGDQFHLVTLLRLGAALILLGQAFAQQPPDAVSNQDIRQQAALQQAHGPGHRHRQGGGIHGCSTR